ncbi:MAG: polysaccharide deacetylase family protein [Bacteroidetes bacterium]|nr:polysaccharide deacetylase family protein [Bacteroidota bacterium]
MRHPLSLTLRRWRHPAPPRGKLLVLALHQVLPDDAATEIPFLPFQAIGQSQLQEMVQWLQENGWQFPHPTRLDEDLDEDRNHVLITFDDGYANNLPALAWLSAQHLPWLLLPTLDNVLNQKAYWWDILWQEEQARHGKATVFRHIERLKQQPVHTLEQTLLEQYGAGALHARGELDRPLTPGELQILANDPMGAIGYHGYRHDRQPLLSAEDQTADMQQAQAAFARLGISPAPLWAYPNGDASIHSPQVALMAGIRWAFTTQPGANRLPRLQAQALNLRRVMPLPHLSIPHQLHAWSRIAP